MFNIKTFSIILFGILFVFQLEAQIRNDECLSSQFIRNSTSFCSLENEFSNLGAMFSGILAPGCWAQDQELSDVWYAFAPSRPGIFLQIFGMDASNKETLSNFSLAVYEGDCFNPSLLLCSESSNSVNILERSLADLVIGRIYYIRVSSMPENAGTFQLCLSEFNPVPSPEQDCDKAVVLCDKSSFVVEFLQGGGNDDDEAAGSCLDNIGVNFPSETSSAWYKWTAETSGSLAFTLSPNNTNDPEEDLDFAVYRLPNGIDDCSNKELLRCMASGESQGNTPAQNAPCFGPTGLSTSSTDLEEFPGCGPGDDNFVAALNMVAGESYALVVNNFSRSGLGFKIDFVGSGTFLGPDPDFEILAQQAFECDKLIFFIDQSKSLTDPIVKYSWNFGEGAQPTFAQGNQEHEVIYDSFGDKLIALTVETSRGCQVTEILELRIDPCCADTSTLALDAIGFDLICFGNADGQIEALPLNGSPQYLYSLDGVDFQPSPIFSFLNAGSYSLIVQDRKGCEVGTNVILEEPVPLELFLSSTRDTVDLGFGTQLFSDFNPSDRILTYQWMPPDGLSCTDCPNPEVIPPGTTTYTLTITDQDGCQTSRDITVYTNFIRPFYAPTAISIRSLMGNERFKIFSNIAADFIENLTIYDRWGNQVFNRENFHLEDPGFVGWDGRFRGQYVQPGVFVWFARIHFIDNEVLTFSGDFVVIN